MIHTGIQGRFPGFIILLLAKELRDTYSFSGAEELALIRSKVDSEDSWLFPVDVN